MLYARGFITLGHVEQIAQSQHSRTGVGLGRLRQIEPGQVSRGNLEHGDFEAGIGADQLGGQLPPVGEYGRDLIGIEHVAPNRKDGAIGRDKESALVVLQACDPARPVNLDHFRLHAGKRFREQVGGRPIGRDGGGHREQKQQDGNAGGVAWLHGTAISRT